MHKLAYIRTISSISAIPNADAIECATVDGWTVVVKKGEFVPGDLAVYFEIDSWIPTEIAPFLTKPNKEPSEFEGIKGERLRSIRLRKQLSQGLLLPLHSLSEEVAEYCQGINFNDPTGIDLTEQLGIRKWERPPASNAAWDGKGQLP